MDISRKLITACLKNDRRAQERLYRLSFDRLMSISCRYKSNRDDAMAMVNQGFYKILRNLGSFHPDNSYKSWISRIMVNLLIDDYRKNKKTNNIKQELEETPVDDLPSSFNIMEYQIEIEELNDMLLALSPIRNQVFNLYAIDGYSHDEIAKMLEIPPGTSKWHLSKARAELKKQILERQVTKKGLNIG